MASRRRRRERRAAEQAEVASAPVVEAPGPGTRRARLGVAFALTGVLAAAGAHLALHRPRYSPAGYGGRVPAGIASPRAGAGKGSAAEGEGTAKGALEQGRKALGRYDLKAAEAAYARARARARQGTGREARQQAAEASFGLAYVTAYRKQFPEARKLFAEAREEAPPERRGDAGKRESGGGDAANPEPPLSERAAYQETVCAAATVTAGDRIALWEGFIQRYPGSTLINAAADRIRRLNGQKMSARGEKLWQRAMAVQKEQARQARIAASQCGPECLAAVLQHYGIQVPADQLAREAKTGEQGTSLDALAGAARRHGLSAVGLQVTPEGLRQQRFPLIALAGRHYVVVEGADAAGVSYRDRERAVRVGWERWGMFCSGMVLRLSPRAAASSGERPSPAQGRSG